MPTAPRIAVVEACEIEGHPVRKGTVWNLSAKGVYLVIDPPLVLGLRVRLSFRLPNEAEPIRAEGRVAWCNPPSQRRGSGATAFGLPPGCGIEFVAIDAACLERIERHVRMTPVLRRKEDDTSH